MGMTSDEAFQDIFHKSVEQAKASAKQREKDIEGNGLYWHRKATDLADDLYRMTKERNEALQRLEERTTERDYRMREADLLAERIRAYDQLEPQFAYLIETKGAHPEALSALQYALGAVKDAKYNFRVGDGVAECSDWDEAVPSRPHKVMTPEEYAARPIQGWHEVCRDVDGFGGVGVRYLGDVS